MVDAVHRICDPAPVRSAVSPHTADDELRDTLVPVNTRWSVDGVLEAARYYADSTGRRVSIEYALVRDVNDQPWRADPPATRLREHLAQLVHVNVIPLNPTPGECLHRPRHARQGNRRLSSVLRVFGPVALQPGDRLVLAHASHFRLAEADAREQHVHEVSR